MPGLVPEAVERRDIPWWRPPVDRYSNNATERTPRPVRDRLIASLEAIGASEQLHYLNVEAHY